MTKALITLTATAILASSQVTVGLRPAAPAPPQVAPSPLPLKNPGRDVEAARPLLGYVTDRSNVLYSVVGLAGNAEWGEPLSLPDSTAVAFLPPRQEYVLLASAAGLSMARLSRSAVYPGAVIPNAIARPHRVAFSPSGEAAALFSLSEGRIQVLTHVARQGRVLWSVPIYNPQELLRLAISDDGELLVAILANQPAVYSLHGAAWRQLATGYWPAALTFLPGSHDLALSDRSQGAIVLLPAVERATLPARVLASAGIAANLLSSNKQGTNLLAVAAGTSNSWSIDLLSGVVTALPAKDKIDSLTLLRDGQTFLVSMQESPVVVKLSGDAAQSSATNTSVR